MNKFAQYQQPVPPGYGNVQYPFPQQPYTPQPSPPLQQNHHEAFLSEAFPSIDRSTVAAILTSTRGDVDSAYNALLAISGQHQTDSHGVPPLPPRPAQSPAQQPTSDNLHPQYQSGQYVNNITPVQSNQSSYLVPTYSNPNAYSPASSPQMQPYNGSITPLYPPASPNPSVHASPSRQPTEAPPSYMPDVSQLCLDEPRTKRKPNHWAACDGCGANPIKSNRWKCLKCPDYDLCDQCREEGVHSEHRHFKVPEAAETHFGIHCDGCGHNKATLIGVRYKCRKHDNEDYCGRCLESGKDCGGPYEEIKQTELARHVEIHHTMPMPREWEPYLRPVVAKYKVLCGKGATSWLDDSAGYNWFDTSDTGSKTNNDPVFKVETKNSKGHFVSDNKRSWTFSKNDGTKLYTFAIENDRKTNAVTSEEFTAYKGKTVRPTFKHGSNADSLSFQDPRTGTQYRWMSNRPVSNLNDERWDFQRYALFEQKKNTFGDKEVMVADHAWWNGAEKSPETCLSIRDQHIDHAFVMATFEMLETYQWQLLRDEKERDPENFWRTEKKAQLNHLGHIMHWHNFSSPEVEKEVSKSKTAQSLKAANSVLKVASVGMKAYGVYVDATGGGAAALASGGGAGGACGGGGGGGGGGGCGGGGGGC